MADSRTTVLSIVLCHKSTTSDAQFSAATPISTRASGAHKKVKLRNFDPSYV